MLFALFHPLIYLFDLPATLFDHITTLFDGFVQLRHLPVVPLAACFYLLEFHCKVREGLAPSGVEIIFAGESAI
jgi:hypothetical protein